MTNSTSPSIDYSRYEEVLVEKKDGILRLTLNAPAQNNAFPAGMHRSMATIWDDIADDDEVNVIILAGAGKFFSGGGNPDKMQRKIDDPEDWDLRTVPEARRIIWRMLECNKPIIARIQGHAIGLGATVALASDIIVMADDAKIGDPHVKVGLVAGDGGTLLWPRAIGYARAKYHLLTGDPMTAREALDAGLVSKIAPESELDEVVDRLATRLANGAANAIRGTKQAINMQLRRAAQPIMDLGMALETISHLSADHQEAVHALQQGRKPRFTGK